MSRFPCRDRHVAASAPVRPRRGRTWWPLLFAFASAVALAQAGEERTLEHYSPDDGLSQNTVTALVDDDQGFLWIGTQDGLNRFDGHRFQVFRPPPPDETERPESIRNGSVERLAYDPLRHRLWVASNGPGVERIDLADWRRRVIDNGRDIAHNRIERLLAAPDGGAWIGTRTGVDRIAGNASQARTLGATGIVVGLFLPPGQRTPLALDADCALWSIGDTALRRMPLAVPAGMRCAFARPMTDGLWVIASDGSALRTARDGRLLRTLAPSALHLGQAHVTAATNPDAATLLLGYSDGRLVQLADDGRVPTEVPMAPATGSAIVSLHADRSGTLWIGTASNGLFRMRMPSASVDRDWLPTSALGLLGTRSVHAIWQAADGRQTLVGTDQGLLEKNSPAAPWRAIPALAGPSVRAIAPAADGDGWWIGTQSGLFRLGRHHRLRADMAQPGLRVDALLAEGADLWIGSRGALVHLRDGVRVDAERLRVFDGHWVTSLARGPDGRLWIGTDDAGLWQLHGEDRPEPAADRGGPPVNAIWALHAATDQLWAGTFAHGLYRIDPASGGKRAFTERDGLANNVIYQILPDASGRLWLSTNNGLSVFDPDTGLFQNLGQRDGLLSQEFNSSAGWRTPDGRRLWFGGTRGVDVIDPARLPRRSAPARPVLTRLQVYQRSSPLADEDASTLDSTRIVYTRGLEMDYRDNVFALGMAAIDSTAPAAARLRYRLRGLHEDWIYPQAPTAELSISRLSPGHYTLEVQAAGRDGRYGAARTLDLQMQPPPWLSGPAYALYSAGLLGLLALLGWRIQAAVHRQQRQVEQLNRLVAERTTQLQRANRQLVQSNAKLEEAIRRDPLTQASNRRDLQDWLDRACPQVLARLRQPAAASEALLFFMIDLDNFKRVNDQHGHAVGDDVLVQTCRRLRNVCREQDMLVRWGGEEFLLAARLSGHDEAAALAGRILRAVDSEPVALDDGRTLPVTCSVGFAPWPFAPQWPTLGGWQQSVDLADRCLYAAKASGRNAWVGLLPGPAPQQAAVRALLGGGAPHAIGGDSAQILSSLPVPPGPAQFR